MLILKTLHLFTTIIYTWNVRDDVHTHFVTLIVKWTIVGGWVKPLNDKRDKVGTIKSPKNLG